MAYFSFQCRLSSAKIFTYGIGMVITTSSNSRCSTPCSSSYSIFTSHPPCPFSEGQQLTTFVNKFKLILDYLLTFNYMEIQLSIVKNSSLLDSGIRESSVV